MRLADARHPAVEHHAECWHHIAMGKWQLKPVVAPPARQGLVWMNFSYNEQSTCYRTRANSYMRLADARHPAVGHHAEC